MTVPANSRRRTHICDGITTQFNGPMAYSRNDIAGFVTTDAGTVPVNPASITVARLGRESGTRVTITPALEAGGVLTLLRTVPYSQETDITNQGAFLPETLEKGMDMLAMQIQQLEDMAGRSPTLGDGDIDGSGAYRANGNRLSGLGDGVAAGDAVTVGQLTAMLPVPSGFIQAGAGAVLRTGQDKMREVFTIKDFGAVGDGAYDCTAAIQTAINSIPEGSMLVVPSGVFVFGPITCRRRIHLRVDGTLKYRDQGGVPIDAEAAGFCLSGHGDIDLNGGFNAGVYVGGDGVAVSDVTIHNMLGTPASTGVCAALYVHHSARPVINGVKVRNILRGGGTSPSQPRAFVFSFCTDAVVNNPQVREAWTAFVISSNNRVFINSPVITNSQATTDNAFYIIGGDRTYITNPTVFNWNDEIVVFSGTSNAYVFGGQVINPVVSNSVLGFEDSTNFGAIGLNIFGDFSTLMKSRNSNVASVGPVVRGVYAKGRFSDDVIAFNTGTTGAPVITGNTFDITYDTGFTDMTLLTMSGVDGFVVDANTWIIRDGAIAAPASDWAITLNCTKPSTFKRNSLVNFTANSRYRVFNVNGLVESDGLFNQANIDAKREPKYGAPAVGGPKEVFGSAVPAAGTWNRGDRVVNTSPSAGGNIGWVCTASGSPGTWKTYGTIEA